MTNKNSLTIPNIISALKEAGFATKQDVEDIVFEGLTEFHHNMTKPELDKLGNEIAHTNSELSKLNNKVDHLAKDFKGLLAEFSLTPSRKKVDDLEKRVEKIEDHIFA